MKRADTRFGLCAVIVESLGAMALLYLVFPSADRATSPAPVPAETVSAESVSAESAAAGPATSESVSAASVELFPDAEHSVARMPPDLPTLHLPAPPLPAPPIGERVPSTATKNVAATTHDGPARREFVSHELEYSRRALTTMLEQHLQRLVEPFGARE